MQCEARAAQGRCKGDNDTIAIGAHGEKESIAVNAYGGTYSQKVTSVAKGANVCATVDAGTSAECVCRRRRATWLAPEAGSEGSESRSDVTDVTGSESLSAAALALVVRGEGAVGGATPALTLAGAVPSVPSVTGAVALRRSRASRHVAGVGAAAAVAPPV